MALSKSSLDRHRQQKLVSYAHAEAGAGASGKRNKKRGREDDASGSEGGVSGYGGDEEKKKKKKRKKQEKKRKKKEKKIKGDPEEEEEEEKKEKEEENTGEESRRKRKFACPFAKHDPDKYQSIKTCCGPGWDKVHRVKEHVYRSHSLRNSCLRCFAHFDSAKLLQEHLQTDEVCKVRERPPHTITEEQEEQLRVRAKSGCAEEKKWTEMYRIIFPEDKNIPSPYYDSGANYSSRRDRLHPEDLELACEILCERILSLVQPEIEKCVNAQFEKVQRMPLPSPPPIPGPMLPRSRRASPAGRKARVSGGGVADADASSLQSGISESPSAMIRNVLDEVYNDLSDPLGNNDQWPFGDEELFQG
ncbi:hypothetical protein VTH06DRAFT_990 [Thermothelomyces fergusii]